jgi:hypothetical protein
MPALENHFKLVDYIKDLITKSQSKEQENKYRAFLKSVVNLEKYFILN